MGKIDSLRELGSKEHDKELFFEALNQAIDQWEKNNLYSQRMEASHAPEEIESFEDIKKLPTVDMREFKDHPKDLTIGNVDREYALFSSGTTSDSKSFTLRSEEGYDRHKGNFKDFADFLMPDLDFMHIMGPGKKMLEKMPEKEAKRAVFTYPLWIFDKFDNEFYLEKTEEGMSPDVDSMIENIKTKEGSQGVFSTPNNLYKVAKKLDEKGVTVDLGPEGLVVTAGGWKGASGSNKEEFRELLQTVFGIDIENHLDFYGCTEIFFPTGNHYGDENPDKKRIPPMGYIWVADEEKFRKEGVLEPVENGEPGLLVSVDPSNTDYPGVLLTDDIVKKTGGEYGKDVRFEYVGRSSL